MSDAMLVGIGAFVGANARYLLSTWLQGIDAAFPWGTLAANALGSLLIGVLYTLIAEHAMGSAPYEVYRPLLAVGFCGAFTTFSSYAYETIDHVSKGHWDLAVVNALANNALSFLGVLLGIWLVVRWQSLGGGGMAS